MNPKTKLSSDIHNWINLWRHKSLEGVIIAEKETYDVMFFNNVITNLFNNKNRRKIGNLYELFDGETLNKFDDDILEEKKIMLDRKGKYIELIVKKDEKYYIIFVKDCTELYQCKRTVKDLKIINQNLMNIYEEYADDTIGIINSKGIIELTGQSFADYCGVELTDLIGKNVLDLEKKKIFYPSVWSRVISSNHMEVILQTTKKGNQRICFGYPIRDDDGNIKQVISITKDFKKQVKIGELISTSSLCPLKEEYGFVNKSKYEMEFSTCNTKMIQTIQLAKAVADTNVTVLITGETGVGKQVLAEYIQRNSTRKKNPFIRVNCGAITPSLVESELFGYEEGSFTGASAGGKKGFLEAANGGTILLDDICELPLNQQVKLLQVLQEKCMSRVGGTDCIPLDIRIIVTTNKDLRAQVEKGEFREDLFYRINVVPLEVPPLRRRKEDIVLLIKKFLTDFNKIYQKEVVLLDNVVEQMKKYDWPGNVRELENFIERLVVTSAEVFIDVYDLPNIMKNGSSSQHTLSVTRVIPMRLAHEELERKLIKMALEESPTDNVAAKLLGISPASFSRKKINI